MVLGAPVAPPPVPAPSPTPAPPRPRSLLDTLRVGVILAFSNDETRPAAIAYTAGVLAIGVLAGGALVYVLKR